MLSVLRDPRHAGLLRMTSFLNAIKEFVILRRRAPRELEEYSGGLRCPLYALMKRSILR